MHPSARPLRPLAAAVACVALLLGVSPADASSVPELQGAPDGCPVLLSGTERAGTLPDGPEVGQFGSGNTHVTGVGFSYENGDLTVAFKVREMRREVRPGMRYAYWFAQMNVVLGGSGSNKVVTVRYDALLDEYSSYVGNYPSGNLRATEITEQLGPGGGVAVTFPGNLIGAFPGSDLTSIKAEGGDFIQYPYGETPLAPHSAGIWSPRNYLDVAGEFPVLPCPGLRFQALDRGDGRGLQFRGASLPRKAGVSIVVERLVGGSWEPLTSFVTGAQGRFQQDFAMAPGQHTVRATLHTDPPVLSAPVSVTATD